MEDEHHIFSNCSHFDNWRQEAGQQLKNTLATRLNQTKLDNKTVEDLLNKAEFFYKYDLNVWPLGDSQYYLGYVPKIREWIKKEKLSQIALERFEHGIYCDWHNTGVRLASRIFGELQRRATRAWDERKGKMGR